MEVVVCRRDIVAPTLRKCESDERALVVLDTVRFGEEARGCASQGAGRADVLWVRGVGVEEVD